MLIFTLNNCHYKVFGLVKRLGFAGGKLNFEPILDLRFVDSDVSHLEKLVTCVLAINLLAITVYFWILRLL